MRPKQRTARTGRVSAIVIALALAVPMFAAAVAVTPAPAAAQAVQTGEVTSAGTEFWFAFPQNLELERVNADIRLFVAGGSGTTVTVAIPGLDVGGSPFSTQAIVPAEGLVTIDLPNETQVTTDDGVQPLGVRVTADAAVTVYGLNFAPFTSDAFLAFPTAALGTEYRVLTYNVTAQDSDGSGSLGDAGFAVVGTQDGTTVTIIPSATVGTRTVGVPFTVELDAGDVYQLKSDDTLDQRNGVDLSGSLVTSDRPVAVLGFAECAFIYSGTFDLYCDTVVQQLTPVDYWATAFAVPVLEPRSASTVRILAATDGTEVTVSGEAPVTIDAGELHEVKATADLLITSTHPVLVAQYAHGNEEDFGTPAQVGDPFMMLIPGVEQLLTSYTIATGGSGYDAHRVNITTTTAGIDGITRNGDPVLSSEFREIGGAGSGVWAATLLIPDGIHTFEGTEDFGLFVYGWTVDESYGYPGGTAFRFIGFDGITLPVLDGEEATLTVGTERCLAATLAGPEDLDLSGVPVLWTIAGANPATATVATDSDGASTFCYTPSEVGTDTVTVTAGTVSATLALTVEAAPVVEETTSEETVVEEKTSEETVVEETTSEETVVEDDGDSTDDAAGNPVPTVVPAGQGSPDRMLLGLALALAAGGLAAGVRTARSAIRG